MLNTSIPDLIDHALMKIERAIASGWAEEENAVIVAHSSIYKTILRNPSLYEGVSTMRNLAEEIHLKSRLFGYDLYILDGEPTEGMPPLLPAFICGNGAVYTGTDGGYLINEGHLYHGFKTSEHLPLLFSDTGLTVNPELVVRGREAQEEKPMEQPDKDTLENFLRSGG